jgi:hypothetical protein
VAAEAPVWPAADARRVVLGSDSAVLAGVALGSGVQFSDNGLERFLTATRRQNFLVPPRRHRAFPLIELS